MNKHSRLSSDRWFGHLTGGFAISYLVLLTAMVAALAGHTTPSSIWSVLSRPEVLASLRLTLLASTVATAAALVVAMPVAAWVTRHRRAGLVDTILDLPHVMPPLVLGLSLLVLLQMPPFRALAPWIVYQVPSVFLVQFVVAVSHAVPILRASLARDSGRAEQMAMVMGCTVASAFVRVTVPENRDGLIQAATMAWARCVGTFGPILVLAGATRNKTEVLSTTIYLELTIGDLSSAVATSVVLILLSGLSLATLRLTLR
ncbi:MAG: molybdenum ABC transporter permease [Planctomycetota bacterium]